MKKAISILTIMLLSLSILYAEEKGYSINSYQKESLYPYYMGLMEFVIPGSGFLAQKDYKMGAISLSVRLSLGLLTYYLYSYWIYYKSLRIAADEMDNYNQKRLYYLDPITGEYATYYDFKLKEARFSFFTSLSLMLYITTSSIFSYLSYKKSKEIIEQKYIPKIQISLNLKEIKISEVYRF